MTYKVLVLALAATGTSGHKLQSLFANKHHHRMEDPPNTLPPPIILPVIMPTLPAPLTFVPQPIAPPGQPIMMTVEPQYECPYGFDLVDGRCLNHEVMTPDLICMEPYHSVDGGCYEYINSIILCPDGSQERNGDCLVETASPAGFQCQDGHIPTENGLACREIKQAPVSCPNSYILTPDGLCQRSVKPKLECPEDFSLIRNKCEKIHTSPAIPSCPKNSSLDSTQTLCVGEMTTIGHIKCPHRYSVQNNRCVKRSSPELDNCPEGTTAGRGNDCVRTVFTAPLQLCSDGSLPQPDCSHVLSTTLQEIVATCPDAFPTLIDGICVRQVGAIAVCDDPAEVPIRDNETGTVFCQSVIYTELTECCPPNFEPNDVGECVKIEMIPPSASSCVGTCYKVRTYTPLWSCPANTELVGRDCVYTDMPSLRSIRQGRVCDEEAGKCMESAAFSVPAVPLCEAGEFDGKFCIERVAYEPVVGCPYGEMDEESGMCVHVERVSMKSDCEEGSTRIDNQCIQFLRTPASFFCEGGQIVESGELCMQSVSPIRRVNQIADKPNLSCPDGGILTASGLCQSSTIVPRALYCLPGTELIDDACVETIEPSPVHQAKKFHKARYMCPDGSHPRLMRYCDSKEYVPSQLMCPIGSDLINDMCVFTVDPVRTPSSIIAAVPVCAPGTVLDASHNYCVSEHHVELESFCPSGYEAAENNKCRRERVRTPMCSPDSVLTSHGCLREIVAIPSPKMTYPCSDKSRC